MPQWREAYPKAAEMKVAVMGCVVNGPGESKAADIGIGERNVTLKGDNIAAEFMAIVEDYITRRYAA